MREFKKLAGIIGAAIIVVTMLFSVAFLSCNAHHDCSGENCPICEMMQMAENILDKLSMAIATIAVALCLCSLAQESMAVFSDAIAHDSPVKLKVKMLN